MSLKKKSFAQVSIAQSELDHSNFVIDGMNGNKGAA